MSTKSIFILVLIYLIAFATFALQVTTVVSFDRDVACFTDSCVGCTDNCLE